MLATRLLILLVLAYFVSLSSKSFSPQARQRGLSETETHSIRERDWFFVDSVKATLRLRRFLSRQLFLQGTMCPAFCADRITKIAFMAEPI